MNTERFEKTTSNPWSPVSSSVMHHSINKKMSNPQIKHLLSISALLTALVDGHVGILPGVSGPVAAGIAGGLGALVGFGLKSGEA